METRQPHEIHEFASDEEFEKLNKERRRRLMKLSDEQFNEVKDMTPDERGDWLRKGISRNKPCPCGSGIKFKKCCWYTDNTGVIDESKS